MTRRVIIPVILVVLVSIAWGGYWFNSNVLAIIDKQILLLPDEEKVMGDDNSYFDSDLLVSFDRDGEEIKTLVYTSVNPDVEVLLTTRTGSPLSRSVAFLLKGTGSQTLTGAELPDEAVLAIYRRSETSRFDPIYFIRLE